MKKRLAIIFVPTLLFMGVLTALILNSFSGRLPGEAQELLDSYLEAVPGEEIVTAVIYAPDADRLTAEMGHALIHAPIQEYRTSPILYEGDIIRPLEEKAQFPLPAQELWCISLTRQNEAAEYYFLARHDNLYGATWVLYQSQTGIQALQNAGCNPQ